MMPIPPMQLTGGAATGGDQRNQLGDIRSGDISTGGSSITVVAVLVLLALAGGAAWWIKSR